MDPISSSLPIESTASTSGIKSDPAKDKQNEFLLLPVAQLKGQDHPNPIEGSGFVDSCAVQQTGEAGLTGPEDLRWRQTALRILG